MKRILTLMSSLVFLTFVACGGGDDAGGAPPPPLSSPLNPGSIEIKDDMINQINALKGGACEQEGVDVMVTLIMSQQQGQGGAGMPMQGGMGMPGGMQGGNPIAGRANGGCDNLLNNIIYNASHIQYQNGSSWINEPAAKMYLAQRLGALLNRVGQKVGPMASAAGIPPDQMLSTFQSQLVPYFQSTVQRLSTQAPGLSQAAGPYLGGTGF